MLDLRQRFEALSRTVQGLAAVGFLALGIALVLVVASREPMEDGRSLTHWIEELAAQTPDTAEWHRAASAVRAMGPKAIPGLVRHLESRQVEWPRPLSKLLWRLRIRPPELEDPWRRSMGAAYAFGVLGSRGSNAVPAIRPLLAVPARRFAATMALGGIGDPAVPLLRDLAASPNETVRVQVAMATRNASELGPATEDLLVRLASDPQERVRNAAGVSLALARASPTRVLPLLQAWLASGKSVDQAAAINALASYGPAAVDALPMLDRLAAEASNPLSAPARAAAEKVRGHTPVGRARYGEP